VLELRAVRGDELLDPLVDHAHGHGPESTTARCLTPNLRPNGPNQGPNIHAGPRPGVTRKPAWVLAFVADGRRWSGCPF
jgi:hypothetical protein